MLLLASHLTSKLISKLLEYPTELTVDVFQNTTLHNGVIHPTLFQSGTKENSYRAPYQFIVGHHIKLLSGIRLNYCQGQ